MEGALVIAVRFGLYVILGLLFGLPAFALYGMNADERGCLRLRRHLAILAVAGLVLSAVGLTALAAAMAGVPIGAVDSEMLTTVIAVPNIGTSVVIRVSLLLIVAVSTLAVRSDAALTVTSAVLGGVALATLAWGGHAAATEAPAGPLHLAADVVHLLAAGAWIGALVIFLRLARRRTFHDVAAHRMLTGFATAGTAIVAALLLTGIVHAWILIGPDQASDLLATAYGRGLAAKLTLFILMLVLAAANRWRLAPRLADDASGASRRAMRRSLAVEAGAGFAILAIAAWLGVSVPPSAM